MKSGLKGWFTQNSEMSLGGVKPQLNQMEKDHILFVMLTALKNANSSVSFQKQKTAPLLWMIELAALCF